MDWKKSEVEEVVLVQVLENKQKLQEVVELE
jgi:hypothetical protein